MSTDRDEPSVSAEQVEGQIRQAVDNGRNIAKEVERITGDALAMGRIELEHMKRVIEGVGRGASAGEQPNKARAEVAEAFEGLQNAMLDVFERAKLTTQEEASRVEGYYEDELKRRLRELRDMEATMLDSLSQAAKAGSDTGAEVLRDTVRHARRSGTRLGTEVENSMRTLSKSLPEALRETALAGLGAARETGARAAEVASGILGGVADVLRGQDDKPNRDKGTGNDETR